MAKRGPRPPYQPQTGLGVAGASFRGLVIGRLGIGSTGVAGTVWRWDAGSEPKVNPQAMRFWDICVGLGRRVTSVSPFYVLWDESSRAGSGGYGIGDRFVRRDDKID